MRAALARLLIIAGGCGLLFLLDQPAAAVWFTVAAACVALLIPLEAGPRLPRFGRRRRRRTRRVR